MHLIVAAVAFVFAVGAGFFDAIKTLQGIKKGVGVEGNKLIVKLAGTNKPGADVLYGYNLAQASLLVLIAALPFPGMLSASATALVVDGVLHIRAGRIWAWMMAHPGELPPEAHTIWQKFSHYPWL